MLDAMDYFLRITHIAEDDQESASKDRKKTILRTPVPGSKIYRLGAGEKLYSLVSSGLEPPQE